MDPTTTYQEMFHAMTERDYDTVSIAATDLLVWVNNGGFPPKGLRLEETRFICESVNRIVSILRLKGF